MSFMGELVRLPSGVVVPASSQRGLLPARVDRSIRRPLLIEEARAAQAARSIENVTVAAMESGAEVVRVASQLSHAVPEASPVLAQIASESAHALGRLVRESGRRMSQ